ncbi:MAG: hypothetical protein Q8P18_15015 [Pseudomonadota bacterium]|nr:hypothetical protein [Pseudomonadota bacterium]
MIRLLPLLALTACDVDHNNDTACTRVAMVSVTVNVTDAAGAPFTAADVTYTAEDGSSDRCDSYSDGVYLCGYEIAGEMTITVEVGGDTVSMDTVLIDADACHVIGETLDVVVPAEA